MFIMIKYKDKWLIKLILRVTILFFAQWWYRIEISFILDCSLNMIIYLLINVDDKFITIKLFIERSNFVIWLTLMTNLSWLFLCF
jgi:hypothetical protein